MNSLKKVVANQDGHGQVPSGKDLLKLGFFIITLPVSLPVLIIKEKLKKKK